MGVQGGGADADGVMAGGGGFGIQDDHREFTPFSDAGDLLNAYFFLEPEVSPVHSLALDSIDGVHAEDSVMHVGDTDDTVAMVDTDDRDADAEMMVNLGGLADVVEGFFAPASAPSPRSQICGQGRLICCKCICNAFAHSFVSCTTVLYLAFFTTIEGKLAVCTFVMSRLVAPFIVAGI